MAFLRFTNLKKKSSCFCIHVTYVHNLQIQALGTITYILRGLPVGRWGAT